MNQFIKKYFFNHLNRYINNLLNRFDLILLDFFIICSEIETKERRLLFLAPQIYFKGVILNHNAVRSRVKYITYFLSFE